MIPVLQPTSSQPGEVLVVIPTECREEHCHAKYWLNEQDCREGRREYLGREPYRSMYALNCFHLQYMMSKGVL